MIPKRIFFIWLSENPILPPLVEKCLASQESLGYDFRLITLENCFKGSRYIEEALNARKWVKASDYLRMYYLFTEGGFYLDADMEIVGTLDRLLDNYLVVCEESNGCFSNAFVGAEAGHPLLQEYLRRVEENFRGDGDLVFEPGLRAFADLIWSSNRAKMGIEVLPPEVFFPYNWQTGETKITDKTLGVHHFMRSWKV